VQIRKLTENDARSLWEIRWRALETEPNSFAESLEEMQKKTVEELASGLGNADPTILSSALLTEKRLSA
jgi:hypothetical protein